MKSERQIIEAIAAAASCQFSLDETRDDEERMMYFTIGKTLQWVVDQDSGDSSVDGLVQIYRDAKRKHAERN